MAYAPGMGRTWSLCALVLVLACRTPEPSPEVRISRLHLGTVVEIAARGGRPASLRSAIEAGFGEVTRLEAMLSEWQVSSEISRLNRDAGGAFIPLAPDTEAVLRLARALARETDGAFDPTILPLVRAYGFQGGEPRLPSEAELDAARAVVGWEVLEIVPGRARLARAGAAIGLGGIAKGFIADRALEAIRRGGARAALVNAGGDLAVFAEDGGGWTVQLETPERPGETFAEIRLHDGGIATSAATWRRAEIGGTLVHHVLDPRSGRPARGNRSATVLAETAARADALATAMLVLGERARAWIEGHPGIEGVLIDAEGRPWVSAGLRGNFRGHRGAPEPGVP